jgi:hypothetical protein
MFEYVSISSSGTTMEVGPYPFGSNITHTEVTQHKEKLHRSNQLIFKTEKVVIEKSGRFRGIRPDH